MKVINQHKNSGVPNKSKYGKFIYIFWGKTGTITHNQEGEEGRDREVRILWGLTDAREKKVEFNRLAKVIIPIQIHLYVNENIIWICEIGYMTNTRSEGREKKRNRKRVTPLNPPTIIKEEEPAITEKLKYTLIIW